MSNSWNMASTHRTPMRSEKQNSALRSQGSPKKGTKSELATSPLPSREPEKGRYCYVTPAFSGVPKKGDKIRNGYISSAFSGARKRAVLLCNPSILRSPQSKGYAHPTLTTLSPNLTNPHQPSRGGSLRNQILFFVKTLP